jgi:hypothetical protein
MHGRAAQHVQQHADNDPAETGTAVRGAFVGSIMQA